MKYFVSLLVFVSCLLSCSSPDVDMIIYNAKVYTVDDNFTVASAIAVKNGKFIAVGGEEIRERYSAKGDLDLNGLPIYPGFIDAHCHFYRLGLIQDQVDLRGASSENEAVQRLQDYAKNISTGPLLGRSWDQNLWASKEYPSRKTLDALFPDRPVVLQRVDGHAVWVNSYVLEKAGITATTQVDGGEVVLEEGEPSGVLIDNAMDLAYAILPAPSRETQIRAFQKAEEIGFANGLTTVDDAGLDRSQIELIDSLQKAKALKMKVYAMISNTPENLAYYLEKGPYQTDKLNVRSVKVYADGALGSRGAVLKKEYKDDPNHKGFFVTPAADIEQLAFKLAKKGFQMNTHAIGDQANAVVLAAYDKALRISTDPRWRVEHAQIVDPKDLAYFGSKIIPSVQPTHATSDMEWADERLGEERLKTAYTFKDLLDWSGKIALGTDFPVEEVSPIKTFYAAVVRKDTNGSPEEGFQMENALSRSEALKGMTRWAAYSNFEENQKGTIAVGKDADFVILTKDIMTVGERQILSVEVLATFSNGSMVYRRGAEQ